ncbi:autotransporter [Mesorhizobium sp.]|uniref:autotransporter n=1 Tax=Mesorhizobium sp. TaxID=1871066 RepID=UPI0025EDDFCE|nr:autotransporter [Mesorhizobium sp.]
MSKATKLKNTDGPALGRRNRLVFGTVLATSAFLGGYRGYVRPAFADCSPFNGTFFCGDTTTLTQTLTGTPLKVTTILGNDGPDFSIDTRPSTGGGGGNAFTLTGTGGLTFTDDNQSFITGAADGINAGNDGSGALSITATGAVTGTSGYGIYANNSGGTDLTIEAANVSGGTSGIHAELYGTGALSITATGTVTGTAGDGIYALTLSDAISSTNLTVETANVSGGVYGIFAEHHGTGALSIIATGAVTGGTGALTGGIYAQNYGSDLTIVAAGATGGLGIGADQQGTGALSITATGTVRGTYASGIFAFTGVNSSGLTINVADVSGVVGIEAEHHGSGALSITASGQVTGEGDSGGIFALAYDNATGLAIQAADVSGGAYGILAIHHGSGGALSITATGAVIGTIDGGIFAQTFDNATGLSIGVADVSGGTYGIRALHGGTGAVKITASGMVKGNGGPGIYARNDSAATGSATTVTVQDSATVSGSTVGVELVSGSGRAAGVDNAGSIAGVTGILANTAGSVTITNAGSITGTGGTAIDLTNAGASTVNQQGGIVTGNLLLSASSDVVSVAGGAITGNVVGGAGDDKVTVSGGAVTGNVSGDDGNDTVTVSAGTVGGSVSGGAGFDNVSVTGGTITGDIDAEHVHLSGGTIGGDITGLGPDTLVIDGIGTVDPLNLSDGVLFSGTNANGTVTDTDLAAGGKSQNFTGFDNFSADNSTLRFGGGTQGINQLNLGNGSTLFINGNVTMPGSIIATNSLIDMRNGVANDVLTLGGLTLNGASIGLDINQQTVQSDQLVVAGAFSTSGVNTIIVNLLGTPQFAQATDIPLIVSTNGPVTGTFSVTGVPGTPGSLFTYEVVTGPNGSVFLRATPANFGIAAAPTSATNAGAVTVAIDALYGINRDALDADLHLSPASGSGMVPVSESFGVFASGQFAHTEHDGYNISGGLNGPGPSFDANDFSAAISLDFNAAKHFQFDNEYGLNIGVFAGYASTDVSLGAFQGFDAIGEGTNKAGLFGGYALFRKDYNYALVSASGFFGGSDVTNGVLGTTGSYDTEGYAVTGSVGHIFKLGERTRFDLRGGLLGVSFRGDPYTDSGGNKFGKSQLSFGAIKLEPGIYGDYKLSNGMVFSPYARGELQQRFGYKNTTEIDTRKIAFDDADFSAALSTGFNLKMSDSTTVNGEVRGKASSDSSTIGAKFGLKIAF